MKKYIPLLVLLITGCSDLYVNNNNISTLPTPTETISMSDNPIVTNSEIPWTGPTCNASVGNSCNESSPQPVYVDFKVAVSDEYNKNISGINVVLKDIPESEISSKNMSKINEYDNTYTVTKFIPAEDTNKKYEVQINASKDNWNASKGLSVSYSSDTKFLYFYKFSGKVAYTSINKQTKISEINTIFSENMDTTKVKGYNGISQIKVSEDGISSIKPVWSPDGNKIAYIGQINGENILFTVNADGSDRKRVYGDIKDSWISWSADSKRLLFESNSYNSQKNQIITINSDSTDLINLTQLSESNHNPVWSPDGNKIIYVEEKNNKSNIILINPDGTNKTVISSKDIYNNFRSPQWSPDSKKIMFLDSNSRIIVINSDGTNEIVLSDSNTGLPKWSPDSLRVVFTVVAPDNNKKTNIYTINSDGTNKYYLINNKAFNNYPSFSYDGEFVTFISDIDGANKTYLTNSDGYNLQSVPYKSDNTEYITFWNKK